MTSTQSIDIVDATRSQRAELAADLRILSEEQWSTQSLCAEWSVRDVVAHLTAAASLGRWRWTRSALGARFDFDLHNARRLAEYRGSTAADTLSRFEAIIDSTTSTFGPKEAWLGEVVVHSADIRRPLGIDHQPPVEILTPLAEFFAARDFTVAGKTTAAGLRLEANDGPFVDGPADGATVSGATLALVMTLAGRTAFLDDLDGPGVETLRTRL